MSENRMSEESKRLLYELVGGDYNPFTYQYLVKYGSDGAIPQREVGMKGMTVEEVYKHCIENNTTWQKFLPHIPEGTLS